MILKYIYWYICGVLELNVVFFFASCPALKNKTKNCSLTFFFFFVAVLRSVSRSTLESVINYIHPAHQITLSPSHCPDSEILECPVGTNRYKDIEHFVMTVVVLFFSLVLFSFIIIQIYVCHRWSAIGGPYLDTPASL